VHADCLMLGRNLGESDAAWASLEGLPIPLAATWITEREAWNFAVYAEHAEQVTLLLYAQAPTTPVVTKQLRPPHPEIRSRVGLPHPSGRDERWAMVNGY
jgi:pullulanase/glycogen debranching enzyme